ncbi:MAG: 2-oxoacid:ferredoxin oxidoreductase subunit beta [Hyphomicrobiaceae bacterium]
MTYITKPIAHHPALPKNALGLTHRDYEASMSTMCAGCGHDSITAAIIEACYELDLPAHRVAKLSGIGCSSKTPTYFLGRSHGFNSVHGRMPSVTTGANMANRDLVYIGVSGDGDTASIGFGQFAHAVRRKLNMTYIVMNNGCYGLTKGQFSATNDKTSPSKKGEANPFDAIDLCQIAIQLGAGFVARSFSGDKRQLIPLIKAAINYKGFAFLDVISPCVTFNNHPASTKSFDYVRAHNMASENKLDFIEPKEEITVNYEAGTTAAVTLHDGSRLLLNKLDGGHDFRDPDEAILTIRKNATQGQVATGLLYVNEDGNDLHDVLNSDDRPMNELPMSELCPGSKALESVNARFR